MIETQIFNFLKSQIESDQIVKSQFRGDVRVYDEMAKVNTLKPYILISVESINAVGGRGVSTIKQTTYEVSVRINVIANSREQATTIIDAIFDKLDGVSTAENCEIEDIKCERPLANWHFETVENLRVFETLFNATMLYFTNN